MTGETQKERADQDCSRRNFMKTAALTVGAVNALSVCGLASALAAGDPKCLLISMAGYRFDPTKALIDDCHDGLFINLANMDTRNYSGRVWHHTSPIRQCPRLSKLSPSR